MQVEETLQLALPPQELWPWLAEPARRARWIPEESRVASRVERADPPRELVLRASGLPQDLEVRLTLTLISEGAGTRLSLRAEAELTGMMIFAEKLIASKAQGKLAEWGRNLRALVAAS